MARLRGHRTLDVGQPLYVRRDGMTVGGRTFMAGDVLPWRELGVPLRKLHQLWEGRRIGHEQARERNGAEDPKALVHLAAPPAPASPPEVTVPAGAAALEQAQPVRLGPDGPVVMMTPGERVDVTPPSQGRSKPRR